MQMQFSARYSRNENSLGRTIVLNNVTQNVSTKESIPVEKNKSISVHPKPSAPPEVSSPEKTGEIISDIPHPAATYSLPVQSPYPTFGPSLAPIHEVASESFECKLNNILVNLLGNDVALLNQIIDISKNIILPKDDLIELIITLTGKENVNIETKEPEVGCLSKLPIWRKVVSITVDDLDFTIAYNPAKNKLRSKKISIEKVILC